MSEGKTDWGFWIFMGFIVLVFWYIWETDTTRESHPDHKPDYARCQQRANAIYLESLDDALSDPTKWQLAGDSNAQEYAERSRKIVLASCR